jgi:hypothetical protein
MAEVGLPNFGCWGGPVRVKKIKISTVHAKIRSKSMVLGGGRPCWSPPVSTTGAVTDRCSSVGSPGVRFVGFCPPQNLKQLFLPPNLVHTAHWTFASPGALHGTWASSCTVHVYPIAPAQPWSSFFQPFCYCLRANGCPKLRPWPHKLQ